MKKMKMDVESLKVDSFETAAAEAPRGTVRAHSGDGAATCVYGNSCYTQCSASNFTDWNSCYGGCSDSGCGPGQRCLTE